MKRPCLVLATVFLVALPGRTASQENPALPTPEEYAKRAEKALALPLFSSNEPLALTLSTDISWIRDERSDEEEVEGTVTYTGADGSQVTVPVQVRARGNFRRDKRNCNFPPLRLNFAGKQVKGTVFEDQDKVKLVTPCHDGRDQFQQYILQEYLVYRTFNLLTPLSFRVRLVHITYEDSNGGYDTRTLTGFLLESDEHMAERNRSTPSEWDQFHPDAMDDGQASLVSLFQYMIGNTDFSLPMFHNTVMIRSEDARYLVVPYDFDWSGVVSARYARPDPQLEISNVRQRVYRGFCRAEADHAGLVVRFNEVRPAIEGLYREMAELEDGQRNRVLKYYEDFYKTLNDPRQYQRKVMDECRKALG